MHDILDLVPFVNRPEWGAWEPLALIMILAGGVSAVGAGLAARGWPLKTLPAVACLAALAAGAGSAWTTWDALTPPPPESPPDGNDR